MPNPTRRRPLNKQLNPIPNSPIHARHRQPAWKPNAVRGTIFLALVMVTIVLYIILWEWERYPLPNSILKNQITMVSSASLSTSNPETAADLTLYPPVVSRRLGPLPSSTKGSSPTIDVSSSSTLSYPATPNTWLPLITPFPTDHPFALPKVDDHIPANDQNNLDPCFLMSFDSIYPNSACRFLLPIRIGEQESKARIHLAQLLVLAQRLGRTLVLPNVGQSRMSACAKWPFTAYYDTNGLFQGGTEDPSQLAIDLDRFANWVDERPTPPKGMVVSVHHQPVHEDRPDVWRIQLESSEDVPLIIAEPTDTVDSKILSCLDSKFPRLRSALPDPALSISIERKSSLNANLSTRLIQLLSSNSLRVDSESDFDWMARPGYDYTTQYPTNVSFLSLADLDVLVLDYDLRHPLFAASDSDVKLHYSPVLYDLADRLADNLGPFLAVHWRMESVPVQNLAWCAVSLVSLLHTLLQNGDQGTGKHVKYVWLATDYPLPLSAFMDMRVFPVDEDGTLHKSDNGRLGVTKSSTFKTLSSEHDDAIGIFAEAFQPGGDLEAWTLTDLADQLRWYPYVEGRFADMVDEALLEDPGVLGILDKLVAVQAKEFVGGSSECSKTRFVVLCLLNVDSSSLNILPPSSFSKQVIEARQESFEVERGKGATRNVVEYFGKW
ncbi:hypothetical protein JVU11DRAFT_6868 [Chiua virens]|nr:hypothetical protein JVU11DRAFT_6868 [Chiua virens]